MIDALTKQPMRVQITPKGKAFIHLAVSQLDDVRRVLEQHRFDYWADLHYFSWDGGPETTYVQFPWATNASAVQAALDGAS
jgi:hypothetical protein